MPQPQTKGNEIIAALHGAERDDRQLSEIEFRQLTKQAEAILRIDAVAGYGLLGMILSHRRMREEAYANFEKALRLSPGDEWVLYNYSRACDVFNDFDVAQKLLRQIVAGHSDDWSALSSAITGFEHYGYFEEVATVLESAQKRGIVPEGADIADSMQWHAFLIEENIDPSAVARAVRLGFDALLSFGVPASHCAYSIRLDSDEFGIWLAYEFVITRESVPLSDVEMHYFDSVLEEDLDCDLSGKFIASFRYAGGEINADRAA